LPIGSKERKKKNSFQPITVVETKKKISQLPYPGKTQPCNKDILGLIYLQQYPAFQEIHDFDGFFGVVVDQR